MRPYSLGSHVRWCRTEDGIVLLDLKTGRYLGISVSDSRHIAPHVNDWSTEYSDTHIEPPKADEGALGALLKAGVLCPAPDHVQPVELKLSAAETTIPFEDVLDVPRVRALDVVRLLRAFLRIRFALKQQSIQRIVSRLNDRKQRAVADRSIAAAECIRLAKVYLHIRPLVLTARDRCLIDSLVLVEFLSAYGMFPSWVIGVRTQPFGAHSWVQEGAVVLNDTPEKVLSFTPILAV